jgi:hypothetical protein
MDQSLFETMRVVALPTKTNFRGISVREVALFKGEYGWGEFSPFLEYSEAECAPWLKCAIEAATKPRPKLFRQSIKVNGTLPALNDSDEIEDIVDSFPGVTTFKVKVGDNLSEDIARLAKVRASRPEAKLRIDVVVSSALESAVGINYGLILAASFPELDFDCGLGTGSLLATNVAELPIIDGQIHIREFEPEFSGHEVAPERFEWWKNRVMKTAELL